MNTFVVFAVLIAGAFAAPSSDDTKTSYDAVCGEKLGVTQEAYDKFDIFGDWTDKAKCYVECELEHAGAWADGKFTDAFTTAIKSPPEDADEEKKVAISFIASCLDDVKDTGCEGAYEFATCLRDTAVGAGVVLFGTIAFLLGVAEGVAEAMAES